MVRSAWMAGMWALGVGGGCLFCIARGSRVWTPSGARAIETLAVGDAVYSVDVRSSELVATRIVGHRSGMRECMALRVAGRRLVLTSKHPVYDAAAAAYRQAGALVGDAAARLLVVGSGAMSIEAVEMFAGMHEVHDISVEHPLHNFVAEGVVVHNKSDDSDYGAYEDDDGSPTAALDIPSSVNVGSEVVIDASRSADPGDDLLHFRFALESVPPGSEAVLPNGELIYETYSATTRFTPDVTGTYRVAVDVFDWHTSDQEVDVVRAHPAPERTPIDSTGDGSSSSSDGTTG